MSPRISNLLSYAHWKWVDAFGPSFSLVIIILANAERKWFSKFGYIWLFFHLKQTWLRVRKFFMQPDMLKCQWLPLIKFYLSIHKLTGVGDLGNQNSRKKKVSISAFSLQSSSLAGMRRPRAKVIPIVLIVIFSSSGTLSFSTASLTLLTSCIDWFTTSTPYKITQYTLYLNLKTCRRVSVTKNSSS